LLLGSSFIVPFVIAHIKTFSVMKKEPTGFEEGFGLVFFEAVPELRLSLLEQVQLIRGTGSSGLILQE
jgi:hypothetical protein